jgi:hypothetical protein
VGFSLIYFRFIGLDDENMMKDLAMKVFHNISACDEGLCKVKRPCEEGLLLKIQAYDVDLLINQALRCVKLLVMAYKIL